MTNRCIVVCILLFNFVNPAMSQDSTDKCRAMTTNNARLACYDQLFPIKNIGQKTETAATMKMQDFLTDYRSLSGQSVAITANLLQTGNMVFIGADWPPILNYAIVAVDQLDRETRRKINADCSTVTGPRCEVDIKGFVVRDRTVPRLRAQEINFH